MRFDGRNGIFLSHFLQSRKAVFSLSVNDKDFLKRADFFFEVFNFFINGFVADKKEFYRRIGDDVFPCFRQFLQIHGDKSRTQPVDSLLADKPFDTIVDDDAGFVAFGQTEFGKGVAKVVDPLGNLLARQPFILSGFLILGAQKSNVRKLGYAFLE